MRYTEMNKEQLAAEKERLEQQFNEYKAKGLKLDMSRGKPSPDQLDLSMEIMDHYGNEYVSENGIDCRNYGLLDGIPEAKAIFSEMLEVSSEQIIIGGNSSLQLMYDFVIRALQLGVLGSEKPWCKYDKVKFLCPVPGYDRHFAICESLGIEMINIDYKSDGPDMDEVERLVSSDESIKGIWCVPMYSNPTGISYSDEVVRRFAMLKPAAKDFRILWDNAYCVHHLSDEHDKIINIIEECEKAGNPDMVVEFASTSKISFPGSGVAVIAASRANIDFIKSQLTFQTIGYDKLNQLHHVQYFRDINGIMGHMKRHAAIVKPKFDAVLSALDREIAPLGIGEWNSPRGGYFISFDSLDGCAKRIVGLAKDAGVVMTGAGATYPYCRDPRDSNIRIAPTYPTVDELNLAMEIFCICVKLASVEKLLGEK